MEVAQQNIAAILGSLGLPLNVGRVEERKLLQKIVYLSQHFGLPTSYKFSWYIHGPYSPALTKDYFALEAARLAGENVSQFGVSAAFSNEISAVKSLIGRKPGNIELHDWVELLSSILYLKNESGMDDKAISGILEKKKPHVFRYLDTAKEALATVV